MEAYAQPVPKATVDALSPLIPVVPRVPILAAANHPPINATAPLAMLPASEPFPDSTSPAAVAVVRATSPASPMDGQCPAVTPYTLLIPLRIAPRPLSAVPAHTIQLL